MANSNMKTLHSLEGIGKIQFEGKQSKIHSLLNTIIQVK